MPTGEAARDETALHILPVNTTAEQAEKAAKTRK